MAQDVISPDFLDRLRQPTGLAGGLPREAYLDAAFLTAENQKLFAKRWICVGLTEDAPEPGSVAPATAAGLSIMLLRDRAGALRIFHNFCRHRGMRVVEEPRVNLSALVCPSHAWSYGLDGALL